MKSSSSTLLFLAVGASIILGVIGFMMFNKQHEDLNAATADMTIEAAELFQAFEQDETSANATYLGKLLEVNGVVQEITETEGGGVLLVLREETEMFGVNCAFLSSEKSAISAIHIGSSAVVKGMCSGATIGGVDLARCVLTQ
ncbi:MAG: hypothetical protein AAF587_20255 [Bacteroidota bacterium]